MSTEHHFAIGTTLANMVNIETLTGIAPHVMPAAVIPLLPNTPGKRMLSNRLRRDGATTIQAQWSLMEAEAFDAFIYAVFGNFTTGSVERYISWLDENRRYSPFFTTIDKPQPEENYRYSSGGAFVVELNITLFSPQLQSVTVTTNHSITTSQRLVYVDSSGGNRTLTLPAANAVTPNTVYRQQRTSASNTVAVQRAGSDTIGSGGTSVGITGANGTLQLASDGISNWTVV